METTKTKILKILFKDIAVKHTITYLAQEVGMSRAGLWKVLKKLENENLILLSSVGAGKTSTYIVNLNWKNSILDKVLSLALTEDAIKNQRWISNFSELEDNVGFLIIYGSILHSPKEAKDIDILGVTNNKFIEIEESIKKIQKTQIKKIHSLNFTAKELKEEIRKPNKAFIDAIKKGIVLFGQDNFIKFIKSIK